MQTPLYITSFLLISHLALACGNPNTDRVIILPDRKAPASLAKTPETAWILYSKNGRATDEEGRRYKVVLTPSYNQTGQLENIAGDILDAETDNLIYDKILLTLRQKTFQTESQLFFKDERSEHPLLQFNIQKETKACRFSWQNLVDTNEDKTKLIYDEVSFEGQCL